MLWICYSIKVQDQCYVCLHTLCGHEHVYKLSTQLTHDFSLICTRHFWFESHEKAKIMQNRRERENNN